MRYKEGYVDNSGVKIHYIDNGNTVSNKIGILICPGLSESNKDYIELMENIKDRRCVALSFRGRGKSDAPTKGYTLEDHIKDIEAVVENLNLKEFCIMGVSRGVSYELGYSVLNHHKLKGLIVDEYPAVHKEMPSGWARESMDFYDKHCDSISITYEVLKGIEEDSVQVDFQEELMNIKCPVLILKGELEETLLTIDDINHLVTHLGSKSIRIERFEKAGHDIQSGDFDRLVKVINEFLQTID